MKVSVVIATYRTPDEALERLIASLDRQTMPQGEFEVIFVDDGSPDDTAERLAVVAQTRPHVRIVRMQNSGWPSKPRNVGTDLARGDYVAYMDHDDELYPDALRAAYEFATAHHSDVVAGKEAYTHRPSWGLATYVEDQPQSIGRTDTHPLLPMNPHKLYRRAFLQEHGIRFREGRRVFWEDVFFNLQVARHAEVISTLSSVPYYYWVETPGGGSTQFILWADDYWEWLRRVFEATRSELADERFAVQREQLLTHQYTSRVLAVFGAGFSDRPVEERAFLFEQCRQLQEDFGLSSLDDGLVASFRARATVLRNGDVDVMARLSAEDPAIQGRGRARSVQWVDGVLRVSADVHWANPDGRRHALHRVSGRIVKRLPADLEAVVPSADRDLTAELTEATLEVSVRSRASRVVWLQPTTYELIIDDGDDGAVRLSARVAATIDPASAAMGGALESGQWDVLLRTRLGRDRTHRALLSDLPAAFTITQRRLHLVYALRSGLTTILPDGQVEAVRRLAPVAARRTTPSEVEITLSGDHDGEGEVATVVGVDARLTGRPDFAAVDAVIAISGGTAVLRVPLGAQPVRIRIGDRARGGRSSFVLLPEGDAVALADRMPPPPPLTGVRRIARGVRRRAGRLLRRWGLR